MHVLGRLCARSSRHMGRAAGPAPVRGVAGRRDLAGSTALAIALAGRAAGGRRRPAGQDRGARRFAHRRLRAAAGRRVSGQARAALRPRASPSRSPMPASPATPPPAGCPARLVGAGRDRRVIVELGANDMLRGIDPKVTRARSTRSCAAEGAQDRGAARRHAGAAQYGPDYARDFDAIYPELAAATASALSVLPRRRRRRSRAQPARRHASERRRRST